MESAKDPLQPPDRDQAGDGHLAEINRGMAKGAAWMVAMRFSMRGIGLVSTVILARLLVPADFGLVAMATIFVGLIEVMGQFGFGVFLIQKQNARHDYYDTAWTLSILRGVVTCGLLFVIAMPVADFFGDPRLVEIFYVLALVALVADGDVSGAMWIYRAGCCRQWWLVQAREAGLFEIGFYVLRAVSILANKSASRESDRAAMALVRFTELRHCPEIHGLVLQCDAAHQGLLSTPFFETEV